MTDRQVFVEVGAGATGYFATFEKIQVETDKATNAAQKFANQTDAMQRVGTASLAIGTLTAVGVGLAISKYAEFDQEMSNVQAATHESAQNMDLLREASLKAGADTVYSATEAAQAVEELAKAGVSTSDVLGGGLSGSLSLAAAGGVDVADAAQTAATALTQFKLSGADIPHVADLLAAGAGKAQGSVSDLSMALNQGGLVASQAGQSIEGTTATLAAFASAGLIGSDAGTSLKTMLLALESPSTQAQKVMDTYGISVYDASGKMLDYAGIADQLQTKLGGLSQQQRNAALSTIFGNDAIRSASVLYDQGAAGITDWTAKVNDAGYAAETAHDKLDNLNGDLEYLSGSVDTALIQSGSAANDVLRGLVQAATSLVNAFDDAPQPIQTAALAVGVLVAAVTLLGGAFLIGVPQIAAFTGALATLSASEIPAVAASAAGLTKTISTTGSVLRETGAFLTGPWGVALAAATVGVVILSQQLDSLQASGAELTNSLVTAKSAQDVFNVAGQGKDVKWVQDVTKDLGNLQNVLNAADDQAKNVFARFDSSHFGAFDALKSIGTQLGTLATTDLPSAEHAFSLLVAQTDGTDRSIQLLLDQMPAYKQALVDQATKLGETADNATLLKLAQEGGVPVTEDATAAYEAASGAAVDLGKAVKDLMDAIDAANGVGQDAVSKNIAYQQSMSDLNDQMQKIADGTEGYAATLDTTTQAGRDNLGMLNDLADSGEQAAKAQFDLDGNTQTYQATLQSVHDSIYEHAKALGASDTEAANLADSIARIPSDTEWKVIAQTADAQAAVDAFLSRNNQRRITISTQIVDAGGNVTGHSGSGTTVNERGGMYSYQAFEDGGFPTGIYAGQQNALYKFAEKNVPWEAFISGKAGEEARNRGIVLNAAKRLGMPTYVAASSGGASGPTGSAPTSQYTVTVPVYAAPGMSENTVASLTAAKINHDLGKIA
ncbi:phage tail tape measure protein [Subtercola sp. YIM 133946]|uniref:phage tail tape measure protein n=1 Tax=Subtercola sp. YIM 133946 TaxID=3118909 RepID=UPI002F939F32